MNYSCVVCSNSFKVKADNIRNIRRAFDYFEESEVTDEGVAFIGSFEDSMSDELYVVTDKRTNKVIGTYCVDYMSIEDLIESNGSYIEDNLADAGIVSEEEYNVEDFTEEPFEEFIQKNLLEGESCLIKEVGHEGMRYAIGCGLLITQDKVQWLDIDVLARRILNGEIEIPKLV